MKPSMQKLDNGYSSEVDRIDKDKWHETLLNFGDANFYQTWSYGAVRWGEPRMSHLILKKNNRIVSIAQLRIVKIDWLKAGAAYLNWGPLWKLKDQKMEMQHFYNMLRALYLEYVDRRGFMLRILPKIIPESEKDAIYNAFKNENFRYSPDPQQTVVVDLSVSMDDLRKNLPKGIRHSLNAAARYRLELSEINDETTFAFVLDIFKEMQRRKNYVAFGSPEEIISIYKDLYNSIKQKMIICKHEGEPVAVMGWQTMGHYGFPIVACTGDKALKLKAGTLLFWKMIEYYKKHGFIGCDLAGVNPKKNPGGYFFKKSLAGRNYIETEHYIGQFDAYNNVISFLLFSAGIFTRNLYRTLRFSLFTKIRWFKKTNKIKDVKNDE
jgi:hypothetical protein